MNCPSPNRIWIRMETVSWFSSVCHCLPRKTFSPKLLEPAECAVVVSISTLNRKEKKNNAFFCSHPFVNVCISVELYILGQNASNRKKWPSLIETLIFFPLDSWYNIISSFFLSTWWESLNIFEAFFFVLIRILVPILMESFYHIEDNWIFIIFHILFQTRSIPNSFLKSRDIVKTGRYIYWLLFGYFHVLNMHISKILLDFAYLQCFLLIIQIES